MDWAGEVWNTFSELDRRCWRRSFRDISRKLKSEFKPRLLNDCLENWILWTLGLSSPRSTDLTSYVLNSWYRFSRWGVCAVKAFIKWKHSSAKHTSQDHRFPVTSAPLLRTSSPVPRASYWPLRSLLAPDLTKDEDSESKHVSSAGIPITTCSNFALPPSCQMQVLQERELLFTSRQALQVECGPNRGTQFRSDTGAQQSLIPELALGLGRAVSFAGLQTSEGHFVALSLRDHYGPTYIS